MCDFAKFFRKNRPRILNPYLKMNLESLPDEVLIDEILPQLTLKKLGSVMSDEFKNKSIM